MNTLGEAPVSPCGLPDEGSAKLSAKSIGEKTKMAVLRRSFLKSGLLAALAAGLLTRAPLIALGQDATRSKTQTDYFQIPYQAKTEKTFYFTKSTFDPYLNTEFTVRASLNVATLQLIAVDECKPAGKGECFSLTFRADRELSPLTTIHPFEHGALGKFELFVAPTKQTNDPDGIYYVAVINHRTVTVQPRTRGLKERK
jgi:hypothetical protein